MIGGFGVDVTLTSTEGTLNVTRAEVIGILDLHVTMVQTNMYFLWCYDVKKIRSDPIYMCLWVWSYMRLLKQLEIRVTGFFSLLLYEI